MTFSKVDLPNPDDGICHTGGTGAQLEYTIRWRRRSEGRIEQQHLGGQSCVPGAAEGQVERWGRQEVECLTKDKAGSQRLAGRARLLLG